MQYKFLNIFFDKKELLNQSKSAVNPFLIENNSSQIEKIYNFYNSGINLLYINGFLGTGKTEISDYSLSFLSSETLVLKYTCFNSTILDDILLSFFNEFKNLTAQNIISEPKAKSENFTQKINSYFSQIEKPFVIIINSFESVLDENRQEILDFILHLNSLSKVKIIVISRTFESKYFKDTPLERISTFALEKNIFEKYLKFEKIKFSNSTLEEFYKQTRGYYFFTAFSIRLMKNQELSLSDFLTNFQKSFLTFYAYLEKQAEELIPGPTRNLFWFLTMTRNSISVNLLKTLNLYDEEKINFLLENLIISETNSQIYVEDYLREQVDFSSAPHISQKIRQYIIDLYQTQLPLKPLERDILISRQTMRKEIEYHQLFLPKRPKNIDQSKIGVSYLAYSRGLDFIDKHKPDEEKINGQKAPALDLTERKNIHINLENLPYQDAQKEYSLKNSGIKISYNPATEVSNEQDLDTLNLKSIILLAKEAENQYDYAKVVELYQKALSKTADEFYQGYLPSIYKRIANAYRKLANYENSINYYNLAQEIYESTENFVKANYVKFKKADIFYETYKLEKSKEMLLEVVQNEENPPILFTKSYVLLANIEEGLSNTTNAFEYYKMALDFSNETMDISILSELYFKIALVLDEGNNSQKAIEFYNKCINLGEDFKSNKFLSSAYSNIANLYLEKNDSENAVENYEKAYEIDAQSNNIEGTYYSSSKLASILQRKKPQKAFEYFQKALECAKSTNDIFYIASASLAIGDYHYDTKQNEIALKHYVYTLKLVEDKFSKENIDKINLRINDIKFRLGDEIFENTMKILERNDTEDN